MNLKGLYETIAYIVVRGSSEEVYFSYGYDHEKSKKFYLHYRRRIPNYFSRTIFNRHRAMIESGKIEGNLSNIYFYLPSITNRSEDFNQYLNNVSISSIEITQSQLSNWDGTKFDPPSSTCLVWKK